MSKVYISYDVETETFLDEGGYECDGPEYWLISKVFVPLEERGQGKARKMMETALLEMRSERP